ncbi:hypothetical protein GF342_01380 [Candidatus Woesearchaeota archaeon]|nr:hypothetical protein [Candidatus Woesearchaeota archaeon]
MNKAGIEYTASFVVTLILGIVLLFVGMAFIGQIITGKDIIEKQITQKEQQLIEDVIVAEQAKIVILDSTRDSTISDREYFWIGIRNIEPKERNFSVTLSFDHAVALDSTYIQEADKNFINEHWLEGRDRVGPRSIPSQDISILGFSVFPHTRINDLQATIPGDYVFNVCTYLTDEGEPDCVAQSTSPSLYPTNDVRQVRLQLR